MYLNLLLCICYLTNNKYNVFYHLILFCFINFSPPWKVSITFLMFPKNLPWGEKISNDEPSEE